MENLTDLAQSRQSSHSSQLLLWQWQSDSDPWKEKDPSKWTWQNFTDEQSLMIEEAFTKNQETFALRDYQLDLKKMVQTHKQDQNQVRRIRRQEKNRFMIEIPEPKILSKYQKTMNEAFGTIQHFLDYIMKRTREAYKLYQKLVKLNLDCPQKEFEGIIQEVISCIEKAAEARQKVIKTRTDSQTTVNFECEAKSLIKVIQENSACLRDFLKAILKAYTMESFVCYWLNELLRSEDWEEINILTPYLVCLVYTFKLPEYLIQYKEPQGYIEHLMKFISPAKLSLYRGASLTKEHLEYYNLNADEDTDKTKYFSWNGVTSTSRSRDVALGFVRHSLSKVQGTKVGALFRIETDFSSVQACEGMIDTIHNACSQYPDEQEIILAPGTVFKLLGTRLIENDIYEVNLQVTKKSKKTFLGSLQEQAIFKDKAIIDGIPSQESFRILELLKGNKLIRKIEIRNSGLLEHIMEEIENMRITTNVQKQDIILTGNIISISSLGVLAHYFSSENISNICALNQIVFLKRDDQNWKLPSLVLGKEAWEKFQKAKQLSDLFKKIKQEDSLTAVDFSFKEPRPSDQEFKDFLKCLPALKSLKKVSLTLTRNQLSPKTIQNFWTVLQNRTALTHLSLSLTVEDKLLKSIEDAIPPLKNLQNLSLNFYDCKEISDQGIKYLKNAISPLTSLKELSLDFSHCSGIKDESLEILKNALSPLISLERFSLSLLNCAEISDDGILHLKNALAENKILIHLSLDFSYCNLLTDKSLSHLKDILMNSSLIHHLSLVFRNCDKISDGGVLDLQNPFQTFVNLKHLALNFDRCKQLSEKALDSLNDVYVNLKSLQYLSLNFNRLSSLTDKAFANFSNVLPQSLQHLSLDFESCFQVSDQGFYCLSKALSSLIFLQTLSLNFSYWTTVTNSALDTLLTAFKSLTSLQYLSLDLSNWENVSDDSLNNLQSAFTFLISLQHLSLNFTGWERLTDKGMICIKNALLPLTSLRHLSLDFKECTKFSDEGINHLQSAFPSFPCLHYLSINFKLCKQITDKSFKYLKNGLLALSSLSHLRLDLRSCRKLSDKCFDYLHMAAPALSALLEYTIYIEDCPDVSGLAKKIFLGRNQTISNVQCF